MRSVVGFFSFSIIRRAEVIGVLISCIHESMYSRYSRLACILMEEKDFDMEKLIKEIDTLLNNKEEYNKISNNAKKLGVKNSATLIYNEIIK